jgi:uracil-DNA glycosylase family 4
MDSNVGNCDLKEKLFEINRRVTACQICPRLSEHIKLISSNRPKRYGNDLYWARPVPSFGDASARLLIIGLAPAAHGGNRTGRMFTGDSSGDWVAKALFQTGFASSSISRCMNDGFALKDAYITAVVRCAPPQNRPTPLEIVNCANYLRSELDLLDNTVKVIVALGHIAFQTYCKLVGITAIGFQHGGKFNIKGNKVLLSSYHPSRQNTNTGRLTWEMWIQIFQTARMILDSQSYKSSNQ